MRDTLSVFLNKEAAYRDRKNAAQSLLFVKDLAVFEWWPEDFFEQPFDPKEPLEFQRWALLLASKAKPSTAHEQWQRSYLSEERPLSLRVLAARLLLSEQDLSACLEIFRVGLTSEDIEQSLDTAETVGLLLAQKNLYSSDLAKLLLEQISFSPPALQRPLLQALALLPNPSTAILSQLQNIHTLRPSAQSFLKHLLHAWESSNDASASLLSILPEDEEDKDVVPNSTQVLPESESPISSSSMEASEPCISEPEPPSSILLSPQPTNKGFLSPFFASFFCLAAFLFALIQSFTIRQTDPQTPIVTPIASSTGGRNSPRSYRQGTLPSQSQGYKPTRYGG